MVIHRWIIPIIGLLLALLLAIRGSVAGTDNPSVQSELAPTSTPAMHDTHPATATITLPPVDPAEVTGDIVIAGSGTRATTATLNQAKHAWLYAMGQMALNERVYLPLVVQMNVETPTPEPTTEPAREIMGCPTLIPRTDSLTDTIRHEIEGTRCKYPPVPLQTIVRLINQGKEARRIVAAELNADQATERPPTQQLTGTAFVEADLNADGQPELLLARSSAVYAIEGTLGLATPKHNGEYVLTTSAHFRSLITPRVQEIADINQDGKIEIVVQAAGCVLRTGCFLEVRVFQWDETENVLIELLWETRAGRDDRPGARMNSAQVAITDRDEDGIQEIVLTGGDDTAYTEWLDQKQGNTPDPYMGRASGPQRVCTLVYAWDGTRYLNTEKMCYPDASQHPWFRLNDGNAAMTQGDFATAIALYRDGLSRPHPQEVPHDWSRPHDQARLFALLRFRLLLALVLQGELDEAENVVQEAQAQDGELAAMAPAFWDTYQQTGNARQGCEAARTETDKLKDPYIRGYDFFITMYTIGDRICLDTDPLPERP